ncbi:hypothetical protein [Sinorhizobium sp. RAC02]|uniref:hypothetical protein n=1 Tax=Sinorhizobium sp. RAC02 TaxID=1842534 RepID=UPI00083DE711|nr:hypothetical protein [Sinorhizobium sp. RAC02]
MTHTEHWSAVSVENATLAFLYGTFQPPSDFEERLREKSEGGQQITVDLNSFMTDGPGRYVSPANFAVVQKFFDTSIFIPDDEYDSVADLYAAMKLPAPSSLTLQIQQYGLDIFSNDFAQRAYVWGTTGFTITSAKFVVANGVRSIVEFTIGVEEENFDYTGGEENPPRKFKPSILQQ